MKIKLNLLLLFVFSLLFYLLPLQSSPLGQGNLDKEDLKASASSYPYQLVVCALFHNESFFLKEWLEFHRLLGVEHFYLYNNLSNDQYKAILEPYIQAGIVSLFDWPIETRNQQDYLKKLQLPVYQHALQMIQGKAKWAAFIDLDEFLYPIYGNHLVEFLQDYEDYAGLAVNWQIYGTSWIDCLPLNHLIIESFCLKAQDNWHMNHIVKLIVQPNYVESIPNPHFFQYKAGYFAVNSAKQPIAMGRISHPIVIDKIRINHYWFGSYEWFKHNKLPRREQWGIRLSPVLLDGLISSCNKVQDLSILRFVEPLKRQMQAFNCPLVNN